MDPAELADVVNVIERRLRKAIEDPKHLLRHFLRDDGVIPVAAVLLDKFIRQQAWPRGASATEAQASILAAASMGKRLEVAAEAEQPSIRYVGSGLSLLRTAEEPSVKKAAPELAAPAAKRNCKGELQTLLTRQLQRSVDGKDLRYLTSSAEEGWVSRVELPTGVAYDGSPKSSKKDAEQSAASAALAALSPQETRGAAEIDHKGRLQSWLQSCFSRPLPPDCLTFVGVGQAQLRGETSEKAFQTRLVVKLPQQDAMPLEICSEVHLREAYESSEKAKRASEQEVARLALEKLIAQDGLRPGGENVKAQGSPVPEKGQRKTSVQVVIVPSDLKKLPRVEQLLITGDDFLTAVATRLGCSSIVPHVLRWAGDRPQGFCLYETIPEAQSSSQNLRASHFVKASVSGDVLMLDASAHTSGMEATDVGGPRYELLKPPCVEAMKQPVFALNSSRNLRLGGYPELPQVYESATWLGTNPRSLLDAMLTRLGLPGKALYDVTEMGSLSADGSQDTYFQSTVSFSWGADDWTEELKVQGRRCITKVDANGDAALAALRAIAGQAETLAHDEKAEYEDWMLPFAQTSFQALLAQAGQQTESEAGDVRSRSATELTLRYTVAVGETADDAAAAFVVEDCKGLTFLAGSKVACPELEELALKSKAGSVLTASMPGSYEGVARHFHFEFELLRCVNKEEASKRPQDAAEGMPPKAKQTSLFAPPLHKQRIDFCVEALQDLEVQSVVDLGCGEGSLLEALVVRDFKHVTGVDHSDRRVRQAQRRIEAVKHDDQEVHVLEADFMSPDFVIPDKPDAVVLAEVLEHLVEAEFLRLPSVIFSLGARVVLVTTPNSDFPMEFAHHDDHGEESQEQGNKIVAPTGLAPEGSSTSGLPQRRMRHDDHERELTQEEFRQWAGKAAARHGYLLGAPRGVGYLAQVATSCGPATQIAIFIRIGGPRDGHVQRRQADPDEKIDPENIVRSALASQELGSGSGLWKYTMKEGQGSCPTDGARMRMHYATYSAEGQRLASNRTGNQARPIAVQHGSPAISHAWQLAIATMKEGEVAVLRSPPEAAAGAAQSAVNPFIPSNDVLWTRLELVDFRPPGTVHHHQEIHLALQEAEHHMTTGRTALQRQAYVQARQAFRRALVVIPDKRLLHVSVGEIQQFADIERASLLNQAFVALKLAEAEEASGVSERAARLWKDGIEACSRLLDRHLGKDIGEGRPLVQPFSPSTTEEIPAALQAASAPDYAKWASKAYFRRALAREQSKYLTDALADLESAHKLAPTDAQISSRLPHLQKSQQRAQLRPEKMFEGILERERDDREKREAAEALEEKKRRREQRLAAEAAAAMAKAAADQ